MYEDPRHRTQSDAPQCLFPPSSRIRRGPLLGIVLGILKGNTMVSEMGISVKRWNVVEVTTEERCRGYEGGIDTRSLND
jgi:hypothetical protein